jgi:predicted alpha/beta superfamily hydrolase
MRLLSSWMPALMLGVVIVMTGCTPPPPAPRVSGQTEPIVIGESFTMDSVTLGEKRRITVYLPPDYAETSKRYPVLYLLDGGAKEDFHHITGIVQVSVANGLMDPILVIGIENTERRRDMTGPTEKPEDKKIAPRVGGSAQFRKFLKDELVPRIERDFRGNGERTLLGESLAGLFVVETFFEEPQLFHRYISVSPSLWWNDGFLLKHAAVRLKTLPVQGRTLYLTVGGKDDNTEVTNQFVEALRMAALPGLKLYYEPMPDEAHATMLHAGALRALRKLFAFDPEVGTPSP